MPAGLYEFERGPYPNQTLIDETEFDSDEDAIKHAEKIGATYVWAAGPPTENPRSVWRKESQ